MLQPLACDGMLNPSVIFRSAYQKWLSIQPGVKIFLYNFFSFVTDFISEFRNNPVNIACFGVGHFFFFFFSFHFHLVSLHKFQ